MSHTVGRIVIDKNLNPKFLVNPISLNREEADIQLEVALPTDEVRLIAEKCKNIKMDADIDMYRKCKVKEVIDGK